jgi:hypothetical protein
MDRPVENSILPLGIPPVELFATVLLALLGRMKPDINLKDIILQGTGRVLWKHCCTTGSDLADANAIRIKNGLVPLQETGANQDMSDLSEVEETTMNAIAGMMIALNENNDIRKAMHQRMNQWTDDVMEKRGLVK